MQTTDTITCQYCNETHTYIRISKRKKFCSVQCSVRYRRLHFREEYNSYQRAYTRQPEVMEKKRQYTENWRKANRERFLQGLKAWREKQKEKKNANNNTSTSDT